jgi:transketolase
VVDAVPPALFVVQAEEAGLVPELTRWSLQAALREFRPLHAADPELHCALNLSALAFADRRPAAANSPTPDQRFLAIDAVEAAKSGQAARACRWAWPTSPKCCGTISCKHNPGNPQWFNRDRFVLSNGHGSMLLYALLHLSGYDLPIDELKRFRQLHSKTPAIPSLPRPRAWRPPPARSARASPTRSAWRWPRRCWRALQPPGVPVVDHHTWVFLGDGCLMEGISPRGLLAGRHLGLGKLIASGTTTASRSTATSPAGSPTTPGALRGLRLAGDPQRRRPRPEEIQQAIRTAQAETSARP